MSVRRFDFTGQARRFEVTPQGFLRVEAHLTRTGIFTYRQDGKTVKELRLPGEVFKPDALKSMQGAPVTDLHPSEKSSDIFVNPKNVKALSVGHAGETIKQDGDFVSAQLTITDADAIKAIESGQRKEISLGYTCDVEQVPGEHQGNPYDAIQRNIVVNHIALGPSGWGRAGPACSMKLDKSDAIQVKEESVAETKDSLVETLKHELQEKRETLQNMQGRLDALGKELEDERNARLKAENPAEIESRVNQRLQLLTQCQPFLDTKRFDGQSDRVLKEAVIQKAHPDFLLKEKDSAYIDGMFEAIVAAKSVRNDGLQKAHEATSHFDISDSPAEKARHSWIQKAQDLWREPLSGTSYTNHGEKFQKIGIFYCRQASFI